MTVLVLASRRSDRGAHWACWALAILEEFTEDIQLVIAGDEYELDQAMAFARQLKVSRVQAVAGWPGADIWASAGAVVLYDAAGFAGPAVAQAVAVGAPIIAADAGGLARTLTDGRNSLLIAPDSPRQLVGAMWRLCNQPTLARQLASSARADLHELLDVDRMRRSVAEAQDLCLQADEGL